MTPSASRPSGPNDLPINVPTDAFREAGHQLVDRVADYLESLPSRKVTPGEALADVRAALGPAELPEDGMELAALLEDASRVVIEHSLHCGHPRFLGYITSSPAPVGMLADFLAAAVNPNVASWTLAPVATEIERRVVRWIAEMISYPSDCGGILVSGGNMANFVGFLAARRARADWGIRQDGLREGSGSLRVYVSAKTHTWIEKAADLFGLGTDAIRWIGVDGAERMDVRELGKRVEEDTRRGDIPFLIVAAAGTVGTGAIDPLDEIARVASAHGIWLHVDGAYGAPAAMIPDAPDPLRALSLADSIALDPHKWLYSPLEAGCALVRDAENLRDAFAFDPEYYRFSDDASGEKLNLFEYGPQNSRCFRALKVWLSIRQVGRAGFESMISANIALARMLFDLAAEHDELEAVTNSLSITTFRYVPRAYGLADQGGGAQSPANQGGRSPSSTTQGGAPGMSGNRETYLNALNERILDRIQAEGDAFLSNAVVNGAFVLRACIVNFRTTAEDIRALPGIVVRAGRKAVEKMA